MLDYLSAGGGSPQGGPSLSDMMAQAMPSSVPGAPPPSSTGMVAPVGGASPPPAPVAPGVIAPSGPIAPSMMPPPPPTAPSDMKYESVTQADGSVLLHIKNPDGSLGPAVKIIPAPKQPKPAGGPSQ